MTTRGLTVLVLFCALPGVARSAEGPAVSATVTVKGSDTIGGELGPALARAYESANPGVSVHWEGLGSATAFPGLFDGSTDVGAASRSVNAKELAEGKERGIELKEYVLGYDGIAVIVNPANGVRELTVAQLSALFTGKVKSWSELGGPELPVNLLSRPAYSGTHAFFKEKVLLKGDKHGQEDFAPGITLIEHSGAVLEAVASDRGAVGYVGMAYLRPGVAAIGVAAGAGKPFVLPDVESVRTGTYPIYRSLLLYTRGEPQGEVRRFLAFVLAGEGRRLTSGHGFIPADAPATIQRTTVVGGETPPPQEHKIYRVRFAYGQVLLDAAAKKTLAEVAMTARRSGELVRLVGNADMRGKAEDNQLMSLGRAKAVAARLLELGLPREALQIEARGADSPLATNDTPAGRQENRRVDIELLSRR
jgi:phosphate binding protein